MKGQRRKKNNAAHFVVVAKVDKARSTEARVSIDRERLVVTIGRLRARKRYQIELRTMVELAMARIMREEAERILASRRIPPVKKGGAARKRNLGSKDKDVSLTDGTPRAPGVGGAQ